MENLFKAKPFGDEHCATIYDCANNINASSKPWILKLLAVWPLYLLLFMHAPLLIAEIKIEHFFKVQQQNSANYPMAVQLLLVLLAILLLIVLVPFQVLMYLFDLTIMVLFCLNIVLIMVPYLAITKMVSSN